MISKTKSTPLGIKKGLTSSANPYLPRWRIEFGEWIHQTLAQKGTAVKSMSSRETRDQSKSGF